eukprot:Seg3879.2 transcript_id=Seg3879.2/GoldUCD/mRNA.D3Y31 product="hypothetical protein" pseudo=true protein_id=Seg3879.2/GoldUCD/D3Y31
MHQFNITHVQKHSQDATSVHCWVNDLRDREYDSVLCHKATRRTKVWPSTERLSSLEFKQSFRRTQ